MSQLSSTLAPRSGRPEAAAAIWDWRIPGPQRKSATGWQNARLRGTVQALGAALLGTLAWLFWSRTLGSVMLGIGSVVLLSALLSPRGLYAGVERAMQALSNALSRTISWVLLTAIFYLFFVPFGRLFRSGKKDPMRRFYEPDVATYWEQRERGRSATKSRRRQY